MASYTYSLRTNLPRGYNKDILLLDIKESVITTPVTSISSPQVDLIISFSSPLTISEKLVLDSIVANHSLTSRVISTSNTILSYVLSAGSNGGGISKRLWTTRPLNKVEGGSENVKHNVTTSRLRLAPGSYQISGTAAVDSDGDHRVRFQNITTNTSGVIGSNSSNISRAQFNGIVTSTNFDHEWELQQIASTSRGGYGMGRAIGLDDSEVFSVVNITPL